MFRTLICLGGIVFLAACDDGAAGGDGGAANSPPVMHPGWEGTLELGQGTSLEVEFTVTDAEGDSFVVDVTSPDPGIGVDLVVEGETATLNLHADYSVSGEVELLVPLEDHTGSADNGTILVEVLPILGLASETWSDSTGPEAREHGAMIHDEEADRLILAGGSGYSPYMDPLDDVWEYDLTSGAWTQLTPTGDVPSGGGSRRVAQVPGTQNAYLFGGYGEGGTDHGELYLLDFSGGGAEFTLLAQSNPPGVRALHAFTYDPQMERFIMFGGIGSGIENDVWTMTLDGDTAVWEEVTATNPPTARYGFFYGFDQTLGRLIVFSGAQGTASVNPATDTWILDTRSDPMEWTLIAEGEEQGVPPGRRNGCTVYDSDEDRMFVFGGTPDAATSSEGLYVFDARPEGGEWALLELGDEPGIRSSGFGFYYHGATQTVMGFGNTSTQVFADLNFLGY